MWKLLLKDKNSWNHITECKLLLLDMNSWSHISTCQLLVLDRNTWKFITVEIIYMTHFGIY